MLRGHVEKVADNIVSGWIYSEEADTSGKTVLAFVGPICVGSGKVDRFRQDLLDAGLGDGTLGFSFFITVNDPNDYPKVVVRLEGSDAVLLQPNSEIVSNVAVATKKTPDTIRRENEDRLSTLRWMRGQGWLSQSDFDFLRYFRQFGVYDRTLTNQIIGHDKTETEQRDPLSVAKELLLLHRMREFEIQAVDLKSFDEITELLEDKSADEYGDFTVAIWAQERGRISVLEGSHTGDGSISGQRSEYALGPDRLLFIDTRCQLGAEHNLPPSGVTAFYI